MKVFIGRIRPTSPLLVSGGDYPCKGYEPLLESPRAKLVITCHPGKMMGPRHGREFIRTFGDVLLSLAEGHDPTFPMPGSYVFVDSQNTASSVGKCKQAK